MALEPGPAHEDVPPADETRPPAVTKRSPGRNLPIAIGVGAGLGGLVLVTVYTIEQIFLAVMVLFLGIGMWELTKGFAAREIRVPLIPVGAGLVATTACAYVFGPVGLVAAFALTVLTALVWRMPAGAEGYVRDATAAVFTATYIAFMAGVVALLLAPEDGADRIVIFIAVTVFSDIGGFFAGAFLGRHKMAPTISPKKTWEGFAGSAISCMVVGAVLVPWLLDDGQIWQGVIVGAAVVCSATLGDLIESMLKRDLGIKDMGSLLPEHGGVMDRLDSLLATAPVVWLLLELLVPPVS